MFTTVQELFTETQEFVKKFPKNEKELKEVAEKVKNVYAVETKKAMEVTEAYRDVFSGFSTQENITEANKKALGLLVTARFAALMAVPGAIFAVPALAKFEKEYSGVEIIPESVKKEFNL